MPDEIEEQIEQKKEQYRKVAGEVEEKLTSDDLPEDERDDLNEKIEKRDRLYEQVQQLKEQKEQRKEMKSGGNDPIKPELSSEDQEQLERAKETKSEDHYRHAFFEYARNGLGQLKREDRKKLEQGRDPEVETRAQVTDTDDLGGFLVPEDMEESIVQARKQFGGMREAAREISTGDGGSVPIPTLDDTSNKGEYLGEDTEVSEQTVTIGETVLESHILSSKKVPVSMALLNDSVVDIDSLMGEIFGERIGRKENEKFTKGGGSSEPHGILNAAVKGTDAASSSDIVEEDLIDLKHSVDPAYRDNAAYMFNDAIWQNLKKTQSSDGEAYFLENYRDGIDTPRIDGDPVIINQDMSSTISAGDKTVLYGDFSNYWIRDVEGITVMRLDEVQATRLNVVFLAFTRNDGNLVDAGQNPIKYLEQ
jgi:HK97 family phage major capsid protein